MRPTLSELIAGITRTVNTRALPMLLNSGDKEAFSEMWAAVRMLAFVEDRLDGEFARLAKENVAMTGLLREASDALRQIDHPAGNELLEGIEAITLDIDTLPSLSELHRQNVTLKQRLERFILIHAGTADGGTGPLQAVRRGIHDLLKEITVRDLEAAQLILTP